MEISAARGMDLFCLIIALPAAIAIALAFMSERRPVSGWSRAHELWQRALAAPSEAVGKGVYLLITLAALLFIPLALGLDQGWGVVIMGALMSPSIARWVSERPEPGQPSPFD